MRTYTYPAVLEAGDNPGVVVVTFPDVPEAITQGNGSQDALDNARDALGVALIGILTFKRAIPKASRPAKGQVRVSVDAELAGKIAVLEAWSEAGITQSELARRLGKDDREVRRILDPDHATKLPALAAALCAMDRRLVVGVERIAPVETHPLPL